MNRTFSLNNVSDIGKGLTDAVTSVTAADVVTSATQSHAVNQSFVLPLTQASIALAYPEAMHHGSFMSQVSGKFSAKYASSAYLSPQQPHVTRTTPRRRTPRNAEEFLKASGVHDTENFLNKGYYVGSMFNLNEATVAASSSITKASTVTPSQVAPPSLNILNAQISSEASPHQQQPSQHNPSSSSSSSSTTGFKLGGHETPQLQQQQPDSSIKRRSSLHETTTTTTSVSLANLNFLNLNSGAFVSHDVSSASPTPSTAYYRNQTAYNKSRSHTTTSATTAAVNRPNDEHSDQPESSNGASSATGSDSSSSPLPLKHHHYQQHQHQQQQQQQQHLGPLMSAVSKMGNESAHKNHSGYDHLNDGDDDDDYEYLERNLGAEPPFNSPPLLAHHHQHSRNQSQKNNNDYYTDESYSFGHNDDGFRQHHQQQQNKYTNSEYNVLSNTKHSSTPPLTTTTTTTTLTHPSLISGKANGYHSTKSTNNNNNNNATTTTTTMAALHANMNGIVTSNNGPTAWDHASLASTNSLFSGLKLKIRIAFRVFSHSLLSLLSFMFFWVTT